MGVSQGRRRAGVDGGGVRSLRGGWPRQRGGLAGRQLRGLPALPADRSRRELPLGDLSRRRRDRAGEVRTVSSVLSLILWLPLAGAIVLLFVPRERVETIRLVALATSLVTFGVSLGAILAFDRS